MSKVADDYIVYKKKNHNSVIWYALYRDNRGQRVAISLSKIKKLIYKDYRKQREPIRSKTEAVKIAEKGLSLDFVKNRLSNDFFKYIPLEAITNLGIKTEGRKISFHSMRKTAATIIANLNNTTEASALLGHSNTYVTQKHYISSTEEGAINRFNQIRQIIKISA